MSQPTVFVLGPHRAAVSGVSTHLNLLLGSSLAREFRLVHFQVGSEGRSESAAARLLRYLVSPILLAVRIMTQSGPVIVHLNTSLNPRAYWRDIAYLAVAKVCGARVVYQVHGGALPQYFLGPGRLPTAFLRATLSMPDVIVVLAQCEFRAYRDFVPQQHVVVLPNSIDFPPYAHLSRVPKNSSAFLRLVYVGRLDRNKGLYEALYALWRARAQGVRARFMIAGSGPEEHALKQAVRCLMLGKEVVFAGPVFGDEKIALLGNADVLVYPTYAEGLPYALLESMAAGVPVITTAVGGIPDLMDDGVHGFFVPVGDEKAVCQAIIKCASDRELLAQMSAACRERIAGRYTIDRLERQFSRLYAEICPGRRVGVFG